MKLELVNENYRPEQHSIRVPPVVPVPLYRPAAIAAQRAWALRVFGRVW